MPIDAKAENVFTLTDAPKKCQSLLGRRVSVSTFYRWATKGLKGIRLETRFLGGTQYTSEEALNRFFDAVTRHCQRNQSLPSVPFDRSEDDACRQTLEAWDRELEADGL